MSLSCTTHHYYPLSAQHTLVQAEDLAAIRLKGLRIEARCSWRQEHGTLIKAPELCRKIQKLFSDGQPSKTSKKKKAAADEVEKDATTEEGSAEAETETLSLLVEGRMLANHYSPFDHALLYATFGLYPAITDRWHAIDIRIYDAKQTLLDQGEFKALFRSTYGWGYWLFDRALGLVRKDLPHLYAEPNRRDFYLFTSQLVYNAHMLQRAQAQSEAEED